MMANKLRVVNFNIHGAKVPGRKSYAVQQRSWHFLAACEADLALVQEVDVEAIPEWARQRWSLIQGDKATYGEDWPGWGSVIAADHSLNLRPRSDLLEHPYVRLVYDYAVFGEVDLPDGASALVSSVHVPARRLDDYLKIMGKPGAIDPKESNAMAQDGDKPWALDLFFTAIDAVVKGHRFIVGGDWNNSRLFDLDPKLRKRGQHPFAAMFFTRAFDAGWFECHGEKNEEQSYFGGKLPYQLDHLFCDQNTYKQRGECAVQVGWFAKELSDHAPLITDFEWP